MTEYEQAIAILDIIDTGRDDETIAEIVGCDIDLVIEVREDYERETEGLFDEE